jgi:hypothetical protein
MPFPVEITFRGMDSSAALEDTIRGCAAKLSPLHDRITGCHVVVEVPHRHQRQGRQFHVRVTLSVPGDEIVVSHDAGPHDSHEDAHVTARDAFDVARRLLTERIDRARPEAP